MEVMFEGTGLMVLDLYQDPQAELKNKMGNSDKLDFHKAYRRAQVKDDETVTIASRLSKIGRKPQAQKKTVSIPGLNIAPAKDPSIISGLTQEAAEDEDDSLLGGAYLSLDSACEYISLLIDEDYLFCGDIYPPGEKSLGASN